MARQKLIVYVDVVSPFSHLAVSLIQRSPKFKPVEIVYIPVFLGGIMKETNNRPPIAIKNKDKWINADRLRHSARNNIPIARTAPDGFPLNTIAVQRALTAVDAHFPDKLPAAVLALGKAIWVDRKQIQNKEVYVPEFEAVLGKEDTATVLDKAGSPEVKQALLDNTARAIKDGAFGLPFFVATNDKGQTETFWGFEHLTLAAEHLGLVEVKSLL